MILYTRSPLTRAINRPSISLVLLLGALFNLLFSPLAQASNDHNHATPLMLKNTNTHDSQTTGKHGEHNEHDKHDEHGHEEHGHEDEGHHDATTMTQHIAQSTGIKTGIAGPGKIKQSVQVYGKVVLAPNKVSHIRARFTGVIKKVNATIGDQVKKGQVLAEIESNESLKLYTLKAPFDGMITARHANAGELIKDIPLFTLTDASELWVEFSIFPSQNTHIKAGKTVVINHKNTTIQSTIAHLLPSESGQPYSIARTPIPSPLNTGLMPGLLVEGTIHTQTITAPIIVNNQALQTLEGNTVVFIKSGERYEAHALTLGQTDGQNTQVLKGLDAGDEYVTHNSFLIKADIEKSGAEHSH